MKLALFFSALLLLLAACAPAPNPGKVEVKQLTQPISYYPKETGAVWQYLPNGASLDAPPITLEILGPTVIGGDVWIASRLQGRGLDVTTYRQYRADGVFELRQDSPGTQITFSPPLKEFPAEGGLHIGASWGGDTTADIFFPDARAADQHKKVALHYTYRVVDQRDVTLSAGNLTVNIYDINFDSYTSDAQGNKADTVHQEIWFAPHIGNVRTKDGYFLVKTNFMKEKSPQ